MNGFTVAAQEYEHFSVDPRSLTALIYALCIGILLAALYMLYQKNVPGKVVRQIIAAGAFSAESAKNAEELGLAKSPFLLFELKHNVTLKRLISRVEAGEGDPRYFIPEDLKYRAEVRYERQGNGLMGFVVTVILTAALGALLIRFLPALLALADHIL